MLRIIVLLGKMEKFEAWSNRNFTTFRKEENKLLIEQNKPMHRYRLGSKWLRNSLHQKDFGVMVDARLKMCQQYAVTAIKANGHELC